MRDHGQIARYEILQQVGQGGMATVYRAYDPNIRREVALKIMSTSLLRDDTLRRRFEREAQTIASLEHRAIVPVYDFGEEDGCPFLVMRLMNGGSLADRLSGSPISLDVTQQILDRIGDALDKVHTQGVVHRDLKPGNILFDEDELPYLSDFGIVKVAHSATLTQQGGIIGTPAYMSPEQGMGQTLDKRSDVYSLGVILYECVTGKVPFKANTAIGTVFQHINKPLPSPKLYNPQLADSVVSVINKALAKQPDERFQTTGELARALQAARANSAHSPTLYYAPTMIEVLAAGPPLSPPTSSGTDMPSTGGSGMPSWTWLAGLLLVMIVGIWGAFIVASALKGNGWDRAIEPEAESHKVATDAVSSEDAGIGGIDKEEDGQGAIPVTEQPQIFISATDTPKPAPSDTPEPIPPTETPVPPTPTITPTLEGPYGHIAFVSDRAGQDEIYVLDVREPQNARQITDVTGKDDRDWWPDWCGENLVVFERGDHPWQSKVQELAIVDVNSKRIREITSGNMPAGSTFNGLPSCSHDDRILAFSTYSSEQVINWAIGFIDLDDNSPRFRLLANDGYALAGNVSWSPDDQSIVFMHYNPEEKNYHIYRVDRDDPYDYTDLSGAFGGNNKYPDWSPDGKWVVFTCGKTYGDDRRWSLCLTPSDFSQVKVILSDMHVGPERWAELELVRHALTPNWSPDGKWVAFSSDIDGDYDIYIYSLVDNELINLTRDWPSDEIHPNWDH